MSSFNTVKITRGNYRLVLLIGAFAIKVPRNLPAIKCNQREKYLWNNSGPDIKEMLCPVVAACRFLVIMKRCQTFKNYDQVDDAESFTSITNDTKNWNFGRFKGRTVCLDYGSN